MSGARMFVVVALLGSACVDRDEGEGSSGSGSAEGSGQCQPASAPNPAYLCCDGAWIDPRSDLFNCGGCGNACGGATPFCDQGMCGMAPCNTMDCTDNCCNMQCCGAGQICCTLNGPVESGPGCVDVGADGNCPQGCAPLCKCAAPETPIATPHGDRPIAALATGDLVYSVDNGAIAIVPIARVQRIAVSDHRITRVRLDDGRVVRMTPSHPLADGRDFGEVQVGARVGDATVIAVDMLAYDEPFTHDILPLSSSAAYFVAGELVESTMR